MAEDSNQNTTGTTTTEQPGTQQAEGAKPRLFTQDEVNRIVANRLADAKKEPKAEPVKTDDDAKVTKRDLMARIEAMEASHAREKSRLAFEKSAAKHGLDDEAIELLFAAHEAAKPSDTKAWLDSKAALFGKKTETVSTQTADTRSPVAAATTAPTKVNPLASGGPINLFSLSEEQIANIDPEEIRNQFEAMTNKTLQSQGGPRPRIRKQ